MRRFFTILPLFLLMAPLLASAWLWHFSEKKPADQPRTEPHHRA